MADDTLRKDRQHAGPKGVAGGPLTIAHDYFTQRGGAERVAAKLIAALEPDRVVTAVHAPPRSFPLPHMERIETSFLQSLPWLQRDPRRAFGLLPLAWRLFAPVTEGVLLCSSSGWSHALRITGDAVKVVYCHNPARWLYQPDDYLKDRSRAVRALVAVARPAMLRFDRAAARTAAVYIANSTVVAGRIRAAYGVEAIVIHPPVTIDAGGARTAVHTKWASFFLTVGRGRGYKNTNRLVEAFRSMPEQRLVIVGTDIDPDSLPANAQAFGRVTDEQLRWLYASCRALVSVADEDFGLTPLEANAMGAPALVLRAGGFLDSLAEGVSGRFIESRSVPDIVDAVRSFPHAWNPEDARRHAERFSLDAFIRRLRSVLLQAKLGEATPLEPALAA
jgi:glycosyltransferase involved in cell wall biosynthesis